MCKVLPNQDYLRPVYKHKNLPLLITDEFRFYRIIKFNNDFYGKTISELHAGNLRPVSDENRYSKLFSGKSVSYWADSLKTARAEFYHHYGNKSYISFFSYDDTSSSFPTTDNKQALVIIDGRRVQFHIILEKFEEKIPLSDEEISIIKQIEELEPDCLAYESVRCKGGINYLFFEKGFKKLSLREVTLNIKRGNKRNRKSVLCAFGSDYTPKPESYGKCFFPIAKLKTDEEYLKSEEYHRRNSIYQNKADLFIAPFRDYLNKKIQHTENNKDDQTGTVN